MLKKKIFISSMILFLFLSTFVFSQTDKITVETPSGGEKFTQGASELLYWSCNFSGDIKVVLLKGGKEHTVLADKKWSYDLEMEWTIPKDFETGDDYKVQIIKLDNPSVVGESEKTFSIVPGTSIKNIHSARLTNIPFTITTNYNEVQFNIKNNSIKSGYIKIFTLNGKILFHEQLSNKKSIIKWGGSRGVPTGMYLVMSNFKNIHNKSQTVNFTFVK